MKPLTVEVSTSVYCSSSGHHVIKIYGSFGGERFNIDVDGSGLSYVQKRRANRWGYRPWAYVPRGKYPAYFYAALADKLATVTADTWTFYEVDRDGNERYEELRYHHRPAFDGLLEWAIRYIRDYAKKGNQE